MSNKYYDYSFFLENINKKYANVNTDTSKTTTNIDEINKNYDLYNSFYNSNKIFHYHLPEKDKETMKPNTPEETIDPENEDADKYKPETYACCMNYSSTLSLFEPSPVNKPTSETKKRKKYLVEKKKQYLRLSRCQQQINEIERKGKLDEKKREENGN